MNLSLYSVNAFLILDTEGSRVLAKYYRPKSHPLGESKEFLTLKEQKAFEKGLWQKTKKAGGARVRSPFLDYRAHRLRRSRNPQRLMQC
jgi:hypothetical protein